MTVKIVNLTAHNIDVYDDWGNLVATYRPSGLNARVRNNSKLVSYINGIPVIGKTNEVIVDLPGEEEGTMYIVSNIVLNRFPNRLDLLAPANMVTKDGRVVGCRSFMSNR